MRANRRRDTRPEVALRSLLHRHGLRFRCDLSVQTTHRRVRVDVAFTKQRLAVFVDGCFWHCCPAHGQLPKSNSDYWHPKLARNVARDRDVDAALCAAGWTVMRFWEHTPASDAAATIERWMASASDAD